MTLYRGTSIPKQSSDSPVSRTRPGVLHKSFINDPLPSFFLLFTPDLNTINLGFEYDYFCRRYVNTSVTFTIKSFMIIIIRYFIHLLLEKVQNTELFSLLVLDQLFHFVINSVFT